VVQLVDGYSSKPALISPTPGDLARLVQEAREKHLTSAATLTPHHPSRNLSRRFSRHEIAEIISRYGAGQSTPALARDYGIAKSALLRLLHSEGVPIRKQAITPADTARAVQLYESGLSITEIVEQVGYSYNTVRKSLHESGAVMRPKGIKRSSLNGS
jgi:transposase-like protein